METPATEQPPRYTELKLIDGVNAKRGNLLLIYPELSSYEISHFHHSLVLLLSRSDVDVPYIDAFGAYDDDLPPPSPKHGGAVCGLIMNAKTNVPFSQIHPPALDKHLDPVYEAFKDNIIYYGGPVQMTRTCYLHPYGPDLIPGAARVAPGIYVSGDLKAAANLVGAGAIKASDFKFFLGHSNWVIPQFINECENGMWFALESQNQHELCDIVFKTVPEANKIENNTDIVSSSPTSTTEEDGEGEGEAEEASRPASDAVALSRASYETPYTCDKDEKLTNKIRLHVWRDMMKCLGGEYAKLATQPWITAKVVESK